jgi:hypothetical protein
MTLTRWIYEYKFVFQLLKLQASEFASLYGLVPIFMFQNPQELLKLQASEFASLYGLVPIFMFQNPQEKN